MLHIPKNCNWPSRNCRICANMRRQPLGDTKGNKPSITSTKPSASQRVSLLKIYFFAAAGAPGAATLPRNTLKNSDDAGSTTMTSFFLPMLAL